MASRRGADASAGFVIATLLLGLPGPLPQAGAQPLGPTEPVPSPAQLIARAQSGRADVPRVELAARLKAAGANRDDNKYIDNSTTYHAVIKSSTIGVEFIGNYPDVTTPVTSEQMGACW